MVTKAKEKTRRGKRERSWSCCLEERREEGDATGLCTR